jgi:rare lipoprotein A (peptidoglycan hydrolase)
MNIPNLWHLRKPVLGKRTVLALFAVFFLASNSLWAQPSTRTFNHTNTGFPLLGAHLPQQCADCHVNGVFKGTPRDCASCHTPGARLAMNNVVKPQQHFSTALSCDSCHSTVSFTGAKFNHLGATPSTCANCHNTVNATGKPPGHIPTTASCSTCHRTSGWLPATSMDHSQFTSATVCSNCHNGSSATGKSVSHIPTALNCTSCHSTTAWKPTQWNHTQSPVTNQCSTCHSGAYPPADGKTSNHIPYQQVASSSSANCDSCHKGGYASWFPGRFHSNVTLTTQCATCHLSTQYGLTSRPNTSTHSGIQSNCESCHQTTVTWAANAKPDHSLFTSATVCSNCHNGSSATGKSVSHIPTALNCFSCHNPTGWKPTKWNHTQSAVTNQCSTCHSGAYPPADGKPANHIPYQQVASSASANCDTCHKGGYASWYPGKFHNNVTVTTQCATCHLSTQYGLTSRPNTSTHSGIQSNCENCHKTTVSWSASNKPDHTQFTTATVCSNCHNGSTAAGKVSNHIPTTLNCISCHSTTAWFPGKYHSNVSTPANCSSCHGSALYGLTTKPSNHIPVTQLLNGSTLECNACHTSTSNWTSERMNHNNSMGSGAGMCTACHASGTSYLGAMQKKALNHRGGSSVKTDCSQSGCHRPLGNTGSSYKTWN